MFHFLDSEQLSTDDQAYFLSIFSYSKNPYIRTTISHCQAGKVSLTMAFNKIFWPESRWGGGGGGE